MFWFMIVVLALLVYILRQKKRNSNAFWEHVMAIPGPKSYPLVGTEYTIHTSEEGFKRDRLLAKQYYPIFKIFSFDMVFVNLVHPEDIELVLSNTKHIEKSIGYNFLHDWLGSGLLTSKGQKWHKMRKILTPAFHFSILQEFVNIFNTETGSLVVNLKKECHKPAVDVMEYITEFTLNAIGETSLGVALSDDPKCIEYKQAVHDYGENFIRRLERTWLHIPLIYKFSPTGKENKKIVDTLHSFSNTIIRERNNHLGQNIQIDNSDRKRLALLDLMLKYKYEGADIDDVGIREEVDTFILGNYRKLINEIYDHLKRCQFRVIKFCNLFNDRRSQLLRTTAERFKGHDTTAVTLAHLLMILANEQKIQDEMYEEISLAVDNPSNPSFPELGELKYTERCIKETLRLYPSAPNISRIAGEDIKTKTGYTIPKGCNVALLIYDLHRSPEIWEDPEKFDPDRFLPEEIAQRHPYAYIPFSAGSRNCIGQKYAMLELKSALCGILHTFKLEPVSKPSEMKYKSSIVLRPVNGIKVKFVPRN